MSDVLSVTSDIPAAPVAEWYPLSSGQLAMWLVAQTGAAHAAYTIHAVYELRGELDADALHAAVDDVVAAHESLRTAFDDVDGEPMQRITDRRVDWRFEATPDADDADRRITDFVGVDFDLATGAVFRSLLVRRAADHHLLVLAGHHIVLDGWSMTVLIDGVLTAYRARAHGDESLTALPLQYKDYACWQRQRLADGEFADAQHHWLTTLDGELAPLELPTDRPRPAVRTFRGRLAHRTISPEDLGEFTRLCRAERTTLYAGLCALVRVLLHRYTGQRDFAIGTSVLSRTVPELYDQIGYYLNSLALRDTVEPTTTFRAALRTAQATLLDGLEHHEYPIDQVVRELGAAPAAGRNALFDVMVFLDQEWGRPTADVPGLRVRHLDVGYEYSKMDLSFFFKETAGGLRLTVEYATDLFDDDRIDALLGHVATLLRSCVATPDRPVATLPLLTDAERELVVTGFNRTDTDYDLETPVPQLFERQAARTPDRLATLDERGSLTFAELNARANAVAWRLREDHGVGPGSLVALLLERSTDLMVAVLGVLKAGGGYLPVNVTDPADRVAAILADSAAVAVLVSGDRFAPSSSTPVVDIAGVAPGRADNPPPLAGPDDVGYCIYTSGSTGRPKGVLIEHRGIVNRLRWMADDLALGADDVFLQKTPYVFDVSVWELLLPGVLGATQVMLRPGAESEPAAIRDTVRRYGVTAIHFVPSMLAQYLAAVEDGFAGVRRCVCSGEELDPDLAHRFLATAGPTTLHNYYGPTEATVDVTAMRVEGGPVTIGRPVPNTRLYVLDEAGAPCPVGVDGELCIAGIQVGRGYLNRPELTAARFAGDPFRAGQRMYRTGDIARWLPNGELAYRGRRDGQVKIRGYRIELAEIEQSLREQPGVDTAVVLAQRDSTGGAHLYAYVQGPACPPAETLRDALLRRLPAYMVPARYHEVATMPVTSNGKVDRAALAARSGAVAATPEYVAPRDETERALLEIWQTLLPAGRIGTTDDFFVIGGHSLSALQLSSRISRRFGVRVTSAAVFTHRTIGAQAQLIAELPANVETPVVQGVRRDQHDLSPAQQRVWFLQTLDPDSSAYNIRTLAKLHGTLDVTALRQAAGALVQRHEMLRVTFTDVGGHVRQTPHPAVTPAFDVRDLRHLDLDAARTAAERGVRDEDGRPFRLQDETPLRLTLFRVTDTEHHLLVTLHHIAGDGWSMRLLMRELSVLYQRFLGEPVDLPDLPDLRMQYIDHVEAIREPAHQAAGEDDLRYWVDRLSGAECLELPTDAPVLDTGSGRASVVVPPRVRRGLIDLADTTATTPFEVTMTALTVLLSRLSDQQDVVVGFPVANRPGVDLEHIVGLFLNTLVLRADLSGAPSFAELLRQVSGRVREAYDHQAAPFELLVERLNPVRRLDRTPIFDVLLNYLGDLREEISIDGVSVEFEDRLFEPAAKFPLTLYVSDEGDGMRIDAVYRPDLFSAARIDELLRQFAALLDQAVRVAERPVTAYSLAAPDATDLTTALAAPELPPLPELIGGHAAETPAQVAVVAGISAITYGELWERSARLARCLVAAGCRPGDIVGVTGPRGVGFVVGLLGALRAGAVILPLDPQLPAGRGDHLLSAGKPVLFVTVVPDTVDDEDAGPLVPQGLPSIEIEDRSGLLVSQADPAVTLPDVTPESPAYVFFTSGTTGTPRGVLGWHGALSHFLLWQKETFGIGPGDRVAQLTSASFDVMLRDTFLALVAGGTVVVPEPQDTVGGKAIFTWLDQQGVTVLHAAPTIMRSWLLDAPTGARLPDLRWTFLAGEPLTPELVTTMRTTFPDSGEIVNLYGPTETTMAKFAYHVPHGPLPAVLPVGSPLPQCQVVLLRGDVPCGIGEPGEIVIRTPFRTRGYLDEPAFVRNPHRDDDRDQLYRTGDIGRLRPDGLLEVIGRVDHQVKINGVRVHPAEVATALGRHPRVSACVVVAHKGSDTGDRLVAYVVADEPGADIGADVRAYLGYHLPRAMVPAQVIRLDRIPTNANGKPDRAALPVPDWQPDVPVAAGPAPRDAVEQSIQDIWHTVLDRPVPDVHSDFFVLGGTSLMLLRLFALLDEAFPGTFRVAQLFARPTVASQAQLVAPTPAPIENEVVEHEF